LTRVLSTYQESESINLGRHLANFAADVIITSIFSEDFGLQTNSNSGLMNSLRQGNLRLTPVVFHFLRSHRSGKERNESALKVESHSSSTSQGIIFELTIQIRAHYHRYIVHSTFHVEIEKRMETLKYNQNSKEKPKDLLEALFKIIDEESGAKLSQTEVNINKNKRRIFIGISDFDPVRGFICRRSRYNRTHAWLGHVSFSSRSSGIHSIFKMFP
jgi:hypothetical protein